MKRIERPNRGRVTTFPYCFYNVIKVFDLSNLELSELSGMKIRHINSLLCGDCQLVNDDYIFFRKLSLIYEDYGIISKKKLSELIKDITIKKRNMRPIRKRSFI